ncbi:MAG: hypothetical protein QOC72_3959 [Methylobacteriaceae bacterium]|jgi:hypothetical protein|nr:hypothetical protein [Methylobacteriaceae bacterium]
MILSADQQKDKMLELWPAWKVSSPEKRTIVWEGEFRPYAMTYTLRIEYRVPVVIEHYSMAWVQPLVEVLSPTLKRRPGNKEGELPHVYWKHRRTEREGPFLCLFDPEVPEWTAEDYLAETTLPWSALWLNFYEGWLITGKWLGSGRHAQNAGDKRVPKHLS